MAQIKELVGKSKKDTQKLAVKHRELHSTVSKVGKSIDKVCFELQYTAHNLYNFIKDFIIFKYYNTLN